MEAGNWGWLYNDAVTLRQGASLKTDSVDKVLKAKLFSLKWTGS